MLRNLGGTVRSVLTNANRLGSTLVVVEHQNTAVEAITRNAIAAAVKFGDVTCLLAGYMCENAAEQVAKIAGVKQVMVANQEKYKFPLAEQLTPLVIAAHSKLKTTHIVMGCSTFGRDLLPRVAAKLNVSPINDVIAIHGEDTFQRPIYAGNALVTLKSLDAVRCLTIRSTAFAPVCETNPNPVPIVGAPEVAPASCGAEAMSLAEFVDAKKHRSDRPELTSADVIVSGGRGMKSGENFKMLYELADKLHGSVGASRAAVDAGFVPNEMQIGQTGKIVAPKIYIAVGISGAIQHLAGMKDSKVIVAINKDPDAPIFQVADYGLVKDLFEAVPAMTKLL